MQTRTGHFPVRWLMENMLTSAFLQQASWLEKESQKERKSFLLVPVTDVTSECQVHIQMVRAISQVSVKRQGE